MPLPMIHLNIARKMANEGFVINSLPQFYLGIISPDAIHMRENAEKSMKRNTHLKPKGKKWEEVNENDFSDSILDYITKNQKATDPDFLWGYGIHILTDMYWTKLIYYKFTEDYLLDTAPVESEKEAYYNDTDILDFILYNESSWKHDIWQYLQNAKYFDFLDLLSAQEIKLWNERTLHWFDDGTSKHKNPIKYISKSSIDNFISFCSETLLHKIINTS